MKVRGGAGADVASTLGVAGGGLERNGDDGVKVEGGGLTADDLVGSDVGRAGDGAALGDGDVEEEELWGLEGEAADGGGVGVVGGEGAAAVAGDVEGLLGGLPGGGGSGLEVLGGDGEVDVHGEGADGVEDGDGDGGGEDGDRVGVELALAEEAGGVGGGVMGTGAVEGEGDAADEVVGVLIDVFYAEGEGDLGGVAGEDAELAGGGVGGSPGWEMG